MNKFFEAVANVFRIPDLRRRVFFTLALLAVYRIGGHIPTPGVDAVRFEEFINQNQGSVFGFIDLFSGGMFRQADDFRPRHHALHHGLHHPAVADRGDPDAREAAEGRRTRAAQDYAVDAVSDRGPGADAVVRHRHDVAGLSGRTSFSTPVRLSFS